MSLIGRECEWCRRLWRVRVFGKCVWQLHHFSDLRGKGLLSSQLPKTPGCHVGSNTETLYPDNYARSFRKLSAKQENDVVNRSAEVSVRDLSHAPAKLDLSCFRQNQTEKMPHLLCVTGFDSTSVVVSPHPFAWQACTSDLTWFCKFSCHSSEGFSVNVRVRVIGLTPARKPQHPTRRKKCFACCPLFDHPCCRKSFATENWVPGEHFWSRSNCTRI